MDNGNPSAALRKGKNRQTGLSYLFLAPTVLIFLLFICWPLVQTVYLSFNSWNGIGSIKFTGVKNYIDMFRDPIVLKSFSNNLIWMVVICTVPVAIGILQASVMVTSGIKGVNIFQLILFLPQVFSSVVVTVIWSWVYNPSMGPLNTFLRNIGLDMLALPWLGSPNTVVAALLVMNIWTLYGFNTVVYSAAIRSVDTQLYEAATLDGCGMVQRFFNVTVPSVSRTTTTLLLFALIDSFRVLDIVLQMTKGGPGYASHVLSYYIYSEAFLKDRIGYASAVAVMFTAVLLAASRGFLRFREVHEKK